MKYLRVLLLCSVIPNLPVWQAVAGTDETLYEDTRHTDGRGTLKLYFPNSTGIPKVIASRKASDDFLTEACQKEFKLSANATNLKLVSTRESLVGTHYRYRQMLNGVPVEGADVVVSVGRDDGEIYQVYNNSYPVESAPTPLKTPIGEENALDAAWNHLRVHGGLLAGLRADLVYLPVAGDFRLVYRTLVPVKAPFGYWEHQIDAASGEVVAFRDTAISEHKERDKKLDFSAYTGPVWPRAQTKQNWEDSRILQKQAVAVRKNTVNGTALVFDANPRTYLANESLVNGSPASAFTNAYVTRTLRDISETGGVYSLDGPWVMIADFQTPTDPPSTTTNGQWTATRGNNAFNDAMTYFHIDQNQRYLQSLGYTGTTGIQYGPIRADSDGFDPQAGEDNSFYIPSNNSLVFGHGGVDDNEDSDVILHEYGHALTHDIVSSWDGGDTGAIGEGFGDYWGASYRSTTTNGRTFHPEWAMSWDAHTADTWSGRFLDRTDLTYDPTHTYVDHERINGIANYSDQLWGTPLFQAFQTLLAEGKPRTDMDKIVIESFFGIGANPTMRDMANATVVAASRLFPSGTHAGVYRAKFVAQNILTETNNPIISATPVGSSRVDLAWTKNGVGADVLVAWNTSATFGTPSGTYSAGAAITGGGTVLYVGSATSASHTGLTAGTRYYYKAWSVGTGPSYSTGVVCSAVLAPANDMFANRTTLTGSSATVTGSNAGASKETGEPMHANATGGASVWWTWTAPSAGSVTISTNGSTFDTVLGVYTGSVVSSLTPIASDDDSGVGTASLVTFIAVAGTVYQIAVDGFSSTATGSVTLNLTGAGASISPSSHTSPAAGDSYAITVTSGASWTASSSQIWATVSPASGSGNGTVTVTVAANSASSSRSATITIGGQTHSLTQSGTSATTTISPTSQSVDASAQSYAITVTSNTTWTTSSSQTWASVAPASGSGNGTATVTLATNTLTSSRSATITIGGQTHSLTQAAAASGSAPANDLFANANLIAGSAIQQTGTNINATTESLEPKHAGNSGGHSVWWKWVAPAAGPVSLDTIGSNFDTLLGVYAGSSVSALTTITSDDDSGGNRTSAVSFTAVSGTTYWFAVDGFSGATGNITLNLSMAVATISPLTHTSPAAGDSYAITVTSGTSWTASSSQTWATVLPASGSGNGTVTVTVAANTTTSSRTAIITIGGRTHSLTQTLPAPANDAFANAITITTTPFTATATNVNTTKETGEPNHAGNTGGHSIWWKWVAPSAGTVSVDTIGSNFDTILGIYTGSSVSALTTITSDDDSGGSRTSALSFTAVSGTTYRIAVDGYGGTTGNVTLNLNMVVATINPASHTSPVAGDSYTIAVTSSTNWTASSNQTWATVSPGSGSGNGTVTVTVAANTTTTGRSATITIGGRPHSLTQAAPPPTNDAFANAITITGTSATVTGSNVGTTKESGEPNHGGSTGGHSVWWKWVAPSASSVTISTDGSPFDTTLGIYTGSVVSSLTTIASDDDSGVGTDSQVTFAAVAGTTYQIAVDGFGGATGNITLNLTATGPTISPSSHTSAAAGDSYAITVTSNPTTSSRSATLTIGGQIHSLTQNAGSGVAPTIATPPQSQVVPVGVNVTFMVAATGNPVPTYQWKKGTTNLANGGNISGATSATLTLANVQLADAGSYTVTVTNSAGNITSNAATLTVNAARLSAISCRAVVGAGGDVLIPGIIISGSGPMQVIVRAKGPALIPLGVDGTLAQPQLRLYSGSTVIAENIGWSSGTAANTSALQAAFTQAGLAQFPTGSADCALLATLTPGIYTAIISSVHDTTGVALVEVYELGASNSHLSAISCRAVVGAGGNVLIPGIIIGGSGQKRVIVRASGPALIPLGVDGTLARPQLRLYSGSTVIAENTGWSSGTAADTSALQAAFIQTGLTPFPTGSADCALLATLTPGAYTAIISGANNTTGVALIEVYEVP